MTTNEAEQRAMRRALALAVTPGVPLGPNPRVGCVLLAPDGTTIAEGFHRRAGAPHAEVAALTEAGEAARGATAVVTLEPCNHTGRTGPCSEALIAAGVRRVVFAQPDSNPVAVGGAARLREAGVDVEGGLLHDEAQAINRTWTFAVAHHRPFVTWKFATTLDGRSAAADGTSRWVPAAPPASTPTGCAGCATRCWSAPTPSRSTTPSSPSATRSTSRSPHQPLRAVMGLRDLPADRRIFNDRARRCTCAPVTRAEALGQLYALDRQHVFLEGGPTLAAPSSRPASSTRSSPTSRRCCSVAGANAVADLGITTITDALHLHVTDVTGFMATTARTPTSDSP